MFSDFSDFPDFSDFFASRGHNEQIMKNITFPFIPMEYRAGQMKVDRMYVQLGGLFCKRFEGIWAGYIAPSSRLPAQHDRRISNSPITITSGREDEFPAS